MDLLLINKERKRYNRIIQMIEAGNYYDLFYMDNDHNFGLTNNKFINDILNRMKKSNEITHKIIKLHNEWKCDYR